MVPKKIRRIIGLAAFYVCVKNAWNNYTTMKK
jgi:hypothetical protein